jgi:hypothetical protein
MLQSDRTTWEALWEDVIDYMLPNRRSIYDDVIRGEDRSVEIYDSTATMSNIRLAAGLNSTLTNQNMLWFGLETNNQNLNKDAGVRQFLQKRTYDIKRAYDVSNFYTEVHEMYIDIGSLGTGVLYVEPSTAPDKQLNFKSIHIREIYIDENPNGVVDTVFRKCKMNVKQCIQKWDEKCSEEVKEKFNAGKLNEDVEILHAVFPRAQRNKELKDRKNMRFASMWLEYSSRHLIDEGGYNTMPYIVPRWLKSSGEMYGRSPAISILADIKTLNEMMYSYVLSGQLAVEPPLQVPDEGFMNINVEPRGISYYRAGTNDRIEPLQFGTSVVGIEHMIQMYQDKVNDAFLQNKLELIDKREMTAEEVRARMSENARILGPTMGRLEYEFLTTLNSRVTDILSNDIVYDDGTSYLDPLPSNLMEENVVLKFTSPIARNQRMQEAEAVGYFLQGVRNNQQLAPQVVDKVNWDRVTDLDAEVFGIPSDILNDDRVVQAIRQNRAQQQQQQQQIAMQMAQIQAGKTQAETAKDQALAQKHSKQAQSTF